MTKNWAISKDRAAKIVVWIDLSIMLVFVLAIFRLKFYEQLSVADLRNGQMRIEDFSLLIDEIPIANEDYNNNPDLLAAMIVGHIEDVCQGEAQVIEEMEDDELYSQETSNQVASIHFGLTSQNCMKHLVAIYDLVK